LTVESTKLIVESTIEVKMRRFIGMIDLESGELLRGTPVWVGAKASPYGNRWFMANQEAMRAIAKDKELTLDPHRVLMMLFGELDFENWIHISQHDIAEMLSMSRSQVSRSIKLLERKGILVRGPKIGKSYGYRLNPHYGWKGRAKNHLTLVKT
jgi:biotin operon repressor